MSLTIKEIQYRLIVHGYKVDADGLDGPETQQAIMDFQKKNRLYSDGLVGKITTAKLLESPEPTMVSSSAVKLKLVKVACDKYGDGYDKTTLREDAGKDFQKVVDEAHSLGGIVTSAGGLRSLNTSAGASQSKTSLHYTGLAHDLAVYSGMVDPNKDPYVVSKITIDGKAGWNVSARGNNTLPLAKIKAYTFKHQEIEVEGHFFSLTEVFRKNGFKPISPRKSFFGAKRDDLSAEFWHFSYERALLPMVSTFGGELLKIYTIKELEKYKLWDYRGFIWKKDWF